LREIQKLLKGPLVITNMGLESFYKELKSQGVKVLHLDWRPTAGGNKKMINLLNKLK
jgi:hypothetical protein